MNEMECDICKKKYPESDIIIGYGIRHEIENLIVTDHPCWNDSKRICKNDFNIYRAKYISSIIDEEKGSIKDLETAVLTSIRENELLSSNTNTAVKEVLTLGDKISDKTALFGGSWKFIISFFTIIFCWIALNTFLVLQKSFDPYPYILLNLILSCVAAIQAPIIMMSQNRQEVKDRIRSENDYKVNLKSEIEIRTLHEKVDHLLLDQWSKMMKIQELQIEMLEEIKKKVDGVK
jgi:uncharacterized membrane protein